MLAACRKGLGPLPDLNAGGVGFEGVWATAKYVFAMRCQRVEKWDFRGRDALYLAVTWVPRAEATRTDFQVLLNRPELQVPNPSPAQFFSCDASASEAVPQACSPSFELKGDFDVVRSILATVTPTTVVRFRRSFGDPFIRGMVVAERPPQVTPSFPAYQPPPQPQVYAPVQPPQVSGIRVRWDTCMTLILLWILLLVVAVVVTLYCEQLCSATQKGIDALSQIVQEKTPVPKEGSHD